MNHEWNDPMPESFCEGFLWKQVVPGFDEFFSGLSGIALIIMGLAGFFQPRLEVLMKMMYASVMISGIGTMMLHWKRIYGFNLADTLPLLITLSFAFIGFVDEVIFEYERFRGAGGGIVPVRDPRKERKKETKRAAVSALTYSLIMAYLVAGVIILIYSDIPYIFSIYFGIPYAILGIGGMLYINHRYHKDKLAQSSTLTLLMFLSISSGLVAVAFKIIDSSYCNEVTVWLFPHSLFHILITYSAHCAITFMAFHRSNNYLMIGDGIPRVHFALLFFPMVKIPPRNSYRARPSPFFPLSPSQDDLASPTLEDDPGLLDREDLVPLKESHPPPENQPNGWQNPNFHPGINVSMSNYPGGHPSFAPSPYSVYSSPSPRGSYAVHPLASSQRIGPSSSYDLRN